MQLPFSIIVPLFDRERFIGRALDSCLAQDFAAFEVIVVDDGSGDASAQAVERFDDPRIRLLRHEANRGVSPARNTGISAASGEWIVFLDSDDELLPNALSTMNARSLALPETIARMQFMGRRDTGAVSPEPALDDERWDYVTYCAKLQRMHGRPHDFTPVVRRSTFDHVRFNDDRSLEGLYHLDFFQRYDAWSFPDVVALYHQDAENQLTKADGARSIVQSRDQAAGTAQLLERHGPALRVHAPEIHHELLSGAATFSFLSGRRREGLRRARAAIANAPLSPRPWVILLAGLIGPAALAWLKSARQRWPPRATPPSGDAAASASRAER